MSVLETLKVGGLLEKDRHRLAARMERMFETFPRLKERRTQLAGTLSGGERSMLSIARGADGRPELIVFDEPPRPVAAVRPGGVPHRAAVEGGGLHHPPCGAERAADAGCGG